VAPDRYFYPSEWYVTIHLGVFDGHTLTALSTCSEVVIYDTFVVKNGFTVFVLALEKLVFIIEQNPYLTSSARTRST
jgi:hypothetical protein